MSSPIVVANQPPSPWDICRDVTLSKQVRADAWREFEVAQWNDAHCKRGLRLDSLNPDMRSAVIELEREEESHETKTLHLKGE